MFYELTITSNFTFLTGVSHAEEYMERAALLGLPGVAIADDNSVAGIVRAFTAAKTIRRAVAERKAWDREHGLIGPPVPDHVSQPPRAPIFNCPRLIPAARLLFRDAPPVTALPETRPGWACLSRLMTRGRLRAEKGECELTLADLLERHEAMQFILWPEGHWIPAARRLAEVAPGRVHIGLKPLYDGRDPARFRRIAKEAATLGLPLIASAHPLMHHGRRRRLADVLTAIRTGTRVDVLGRAALANAERRLRSEAEMQRLFRDHPAAVENTGALAERLTFCLSQLRYEYPSEVTKDETPTARLTRLAYEGLEWRYPGGAPERVGKMLQHELDLIAKLKYEPYFLTVRDVVHFARSRDILCQGRGSAANSVVCYCLGVTSVSPEIGTMVFERFVSEARDEPPDIDVDFEHERREEVIQWIYARFGRHRAGLCATVVHYRGKRAIREVGRAMGLTEDTVSALSSQLWGFFSTKGIEAERMAEIGLDYRDKRLRQTIELVYEIQGFPRHLSQHVGGFIMTEGRLDELVPIENATMEDRTVICWDKDDIDSLGILKVDVLSLGMLTCIRKAFRPSEDAPPAGLDPRDTAPRRSACVRHALPC